MVALVQKQDAELLGVVERHGAAAIVQHARPGRQDGALLDLASEHTGGGGLHDLEFSNGGVTEALDLAEPLDRCRQHFSI